MSKKYQRKYNVGIELNMSNRQLDRAEKKILERHPLENWIYIRNAQNGQTTVYYDIQFINWIKEVYLIHDKYYLDLEISFYEKLIHEIVKDNDIEYNSIEYHDMNIKELMKYFNKDYKSIQLAISKMSKEYKPNLKSYLNNNIIIKAEGVKWINEKYYRKSYLEYLERTKLSLEGNKVD